MTMDTQRHWAGYVWAAPASLTGLLLAVPALLAGGRARCVQGTLEVSAGRGARIMQRCRIRAITFGHVVLGQDAATLATLRTHEQVHVRQYERLGVFMLLLYPLESLYQWCRGNNPYRDNRFERAAFAAERRAAVSRDQAGGNAAG